MGFNGNALNLFILLPPETYYFKRELSKIWDSGIIEASTLSIDIWAIP